MILTGDLGAVGSKLLIELLRKDYQIDIAGVHADCGLMLYDLDAQDVNAGASGCGCSGSVVCSYILSRLKQGGAETRAFCGHRRIDERSICKTGRNNPRHCAWRAVDQRVTG